MTTSTAHVQATANRVAHLPPSIQRLIGLIEDKKTGMTPDLAREFVIKADIQTEDVMPWADFGHPMRDGYGRKMVYDGGFFEIMVMSWVPGDFSSIHDHGTAQWGAVKSFGNAEHAVFEMVDGRLRTSVRNAFSPGVVNAVTHDLIHQMGNVDQAPFCSLHLYGSYDHNGEITGDSRIYDLFEGSVQLTTGGVFFCLPESDISNRLPGVKADYPTTLRHHSEMLKRIYRFLPHACEEDRVRFSAQARRIERLIFSKSEQRDYLRDLNALTEEDGSIAHLGQWRLFWNEMTVAAELKADLQECGL